MSKRTRKGKGRKEVVVVGAMDGSAHNEMRVDRTLSESRECAGGFNL